MENDIVSGQQFTWSLVKKLGEGDAGEVYLVESLAGDRTGVLKKPQKSAFIGDVLRQAAQIKTEGSILKTLATLNAPGSSNGAKIPALLDQSKPGTDFSERLFIVIEKAAGVDLGFLVRTSRMGLPDQDTNSAQFSPEETIFLNSIAENGRIPEYILLSCLVSLLALLQDVHPKPAVESDTPTGGIIYNDIKPEHIFWEARRASLTLIDWGNAQFVDQEGMSRDRQYSIKNDFRQFVEEMGKFLSSCAPELLARLAWPAQYNFDEDLLAPDGLVDRIQNALQTEKNRLSQVKERQENLLQPAASSGADVLIQLEEVHKELLSMGEIPDYPGASRFASGFATRLVMEGNVAELQELCRWAAQFPGVQNDQWRLIARLAEITTRSQGELRQKFLDALQAAICSDGEAVLWHLSSAIQDTPEPNWWFELIGQVRRAKLGAEADTLLPFVAVNRLAFSLQALLRQMEDNQPHQLAEDPQAVLPTDKEELQRLQFFSRRLQEDILANWSLVDPPPPHAFLDYDDLLRLLQELGSSLQNEQQVITRLITRPKAQVKLVLDAWEQQEFVTASQRLRQVLIWDPDRRRVLRADRLIASAPDWLKKVHLGIKEGENIQIFATDLEFEGRELRNHVSPAAWLDEILTGLAQLRKGVWPADILVNLPAISHEMPWLKKFARSERLPAEVKTVSDEAILPAIPTSPETAGPHEGIFGREGELYLLEPLDAWAPEARGSSARVYLGEQKNAAGAVQQCAVKLMRTDKADYAMPLFREEVKILALMDAIPGVSRMLECGFIRMEPAGALPVDANIQAIRDLNGALLRIGATSGQVFLDQLEMRTKDGWTPYLSIEKREKGDNLLLLCDAGLTQGRYLPVINLLQMVIQICDIIQAAHDRNIVYRDHKILHYYWQEETNGIFLIDWNVARLHPDGLSDYEKQMDLVQFGARGMHHILTGRAAPGALPLGPTLPEDIERAAQSYQTQWTYDDQRIPQELRDIIEAVLSGKYMQASALRDDLKATYITL